MGSDDIGAAAHGLFSASQARSHSATLAGGRGARERAARESFARGSAQRTAAPLLTADVSGARHRLRRPALLLLPACCAAPRRALARPLVALRRVPCAVARSRRLASPLRTWRPRPRKPGRRTWSAKCASTSSAASVRRAAVAPAGCGRSRVVRSPLVHRDAVGDGRHGLAPVQLVAPAADEPEDHPLVRAPARGAAPLPSAAASAFRVRPRRR